jgi:hypothetical protein
VSRWSWATVVDAWTTVMVAGIAGLALGEWLLR